MKLIKGSKLNQQQTKQVLSAFIYRWTTDNYERVRAWAGIVDKPTIPLISDQEWLDDRAFWFLDDGSRMLERRCYAEPHYMAD